MVRLNQEEGRYRVLLIGIGDNTEKEKDSFCHNISKNYSIPFPLLKKIVARCPVILKKNLSLKKAEMLAKAFKYFGASVSVEEKRKFPLISLEFKGLVPHQLALESSYLRKTQRGTCSVIGRVKNISDETLNDTWILIQLFDDLEEFITFEEAPFPINPLPPGNASPFKIVLEGEFSIKRISISFKNASGQPIAAADHREKREWVEVEIEDELFFSSPSRSTKAGGGSQAIDLAEPKDEMVIEKETEILKETNPFMKQGVGLPLEKEIGEEQRRNPERTSEESLSQTLEVSEKVSEISSSFFAEVSNPGGGELEKRLEQEASQKFSSPVLEEIEKEIEDERVLGDLELNPDDEEMAEESHLDVSVLNEATELLEDISESTNEVEGEGPLSFSWIESFREAVEIYYQKPCDIFSMWMEESRRRGEFKNSLHALLTILVHSRFDQGNPSTHGLENTQRVFRLVVQPNLLLEEIPPLEGTSFVSGEVWRGLFYKAIPKVLQIGNAILEKKRWDAFDLEMLIQVIPHMSHQNSRKATHWISKLIPDVVDVDFSHTLITIGESLYRVTSRLGIVDPHFDYYQGRNSMGDIKIQSFAKMSFPENPVRIEEPTAWMGRERERGGHCFPTQPLCEGCLFETFCPRLYLQFNPSEKGMRE